MKASLRALLHGIIDYAGLFPPAGLPLDDAFNNYRRFRSESEHWMLGRFICPAARLGDLRDLQKNSDKPEPCSLSVLLSEDLSNEVEALREFVAECGEWAHIGAFETRLPADGEIDATEVLCREIGGRLATAIASGPRPVFFEAGLGNDWRRTVQARVAGIARSNERASDGRAAADGFKLRCGGLKASAFPSLEQVAYVIEQCRSHGVPLKFTAGLHHPVRRVDPGLQCFMHGFLNVFVAAILANTHLLDPPEILAILEEQDPRMFTFTDEFLGWNEIEARVDEIERVRNARVISFGSCSFDEPRADLRQLRLL